jgi:hypothetical protein
MAGTTIAGNVRPMNDAPRSPGEQFARAFAAKDFDGVGEALDPNVDFRGLTPNQSWEATSSGEVTRDILPAWLNESDKIEELVSFDTGQFADRETMSYSLRGYNDNGPFVVEQQAYFETEGDRIVWMRVLCSGFRPDDSAS